MNSRLEMGTQPAHTQQDGQLHGLAPVAPRPPAVTNGAPGGSGAPGAIGSAVITVEGLTRRFGTFTAVDGVSFEVKAGEIFGFLGPNGAGKTTTISMLCTLLRPTAGRATINGFDVRTQQDAVRRSIGLIFQDPALDDRLTAYENLKFHAMLYDVPAELFAARAREVLEMVDLADRAQAIVRSFSGGMKRRLEIARGLLHRPRVLFLDEPTIGLDPQTRRHIWEYITTLRRREGLTIFLTTHYMEEAEICDRIAIMDRGHIVALDSPQGLKGLVGGDVVTARTSGRPEVAVERLRAELGVAARVGPEGDVIVEVAQGETFIPRMMECLGATDGVSVQSVGLRRPTLEDVFIKLTGRAIRDEEASAVDQLRMHRRARWGHR